MNERIQTLKNRARNFYLNQEDLDGDIKELHTLVEQKFAELVIRECANIAASAEPWKSDDLILRHFGLK